MVTLSKSIQAAAFEFLPNDLIAIAHKNAVEILYNRSFILFFLKKGKISNFIHFLKMENPLEDWEGMKLK